jgi:glycerol-3-phosphate O-acyltransferase
VGFFIPAAFTALAIFEADTFRFSSADLHARYAALQDFFKYEFSYDSDQTVSSYVDQSLGSLVDEGILAPHHKTADTYHLTPSGLRKLKLFSIFLKSYFESYWIVLNFFMKTPQNSVKSRDRLKKIEDTGSLMFKRKEIERKEALNNISYKNAVQFVTGRGVKGAENNDQIDILAQAIQNSLRHL